MKPSDIYTYNGLTARIDILARYQGMTYNTIRNRMHKQGMTLEEALSTPKDYRKINIKKEEKRYAEIAIEEPRPKKVLKPIRATAGAIYYDWVEVE